MRIGFSQVHSTVRFGADEPPKGEGPPSKPPIPADELAKMKAKMKAALEGQILGQKEVVADMVAFAESMVKKEAEAPKKEGGKWKSWLTSWFKKSPKPVMEKKAPVKYLKLSMEPIEAPGKTPDTSLVDWVDKMSSSKEKIIILMDHFDSVGTSPDAISPAEIPARIQDAQFRHASELQDKFHHLMAAPTMAGITPLVNHIEDISDRLIGHGVIMGQHPNEAEMMGLLWHPKFDDPAESAHADQLVKSLTSVFRFIKHGLHTTPNEVLHSWGHIGKLSLGGFLPLKYDAMGKHKSLLAAYGGRYIERPETDSLFGTGFIFEGKKHYRGMLDDPTVVDLRQAYMLVSHPEHGTLIIRNSSKVFGRDKLDHAGYYTSKYLSAEDLMTYNPKTDPELKPILDPTLYLGYKKKPDPFYSVSGSAGELLIEYKKIMTPELEAMFKSPPKYETIILKPDDPPVGSVGEASGETPDPEKPFPKLTISLAGPPGTGKTALAKTFAEEMGKIFEPVDVTKPPSDNPPAEIDTTPLFNDKLKFLLGQLQGTLDDMQAWKLDLSADDANGNFVGDQPEVSPGFAAMVQRIVDMPEAKRPALAIMNRHYPYGPIPLKTHEGKDVTYFDFRSGKGHLKELLHRVGGTWTDRQFPHSPWVTFIQEAIGYHDAMAVLIDPPAQPDLTSNQPKE